jgi:uncharacterized membrane protein
MYELEIWEGLAILAVLYLLIAPALGVAGFVGRERHTRELRGIRLGLSEAKHQNAALRRELLDLKRHLGLPGEEAAAEAPEAEAPKAEEPRPPVEEAAAEVPASPWRSQPRAARKPRPRGDFEERLASRWFVWLGAITIALGGAFLVKYSIDQGWLGPAMRVALGGLLGLGLVALGEYLRRRPARHVPAGLRSDHVPLALTAAGLFTAFASVYAGFALHALFPPVLAFALLAGIALGGVALSLLHGPLLGYAGLIGAFAAPALVPASPASAWALFGYLTVLAAGLLLLVRKTGWLGLGWATLAGSLVWCLLTFTFTWHGADTPAVALHILVLSGGFVLARGGEPGTGVLGWPRGFAALTGAERLAWGAAASGALLIFALLRMDHYDAVSLIALAIFSGILLTAARREDALDALSGLAAITVTLGIAAWHLPRVVTQRSAALVLDGETQLLVAGPVLPPEIQPFLMVGAGFALLFGVAGFIALWGARRPWLWAAVSAATPLALLAVAYWRIEDFALDLRWALAALALAAAALAAAGRVERHRGAAGYRATLGVYAAAVVAGIAYGAAMSLQQAWLTAALALEIPALAWIALRLSLPPLRWVAAAVAAIVLTRLALNPYILDYAEGALAGPHWVLYGYGLPALAFFVAARVFRQQGKDWVVDLLEGGALLFVGLLASFEVLALTTGSLRPSDYELLPASLHGLIWLGLACILLAAAKHSDRLVLRWGWRVFGLLALAQILLVQGLFLNPLWSGEGVGSWPLANLLALAYLAPALLLLLFGRLLAGAGQASLAKLAGVLALLLGFLWITLEVRHGFRGSLLSRGTISQGELYATSLAWLAYAGALLALAVRSGSALLRYASLAVLLPAVGKVFLIDMAELEGLWRAASFLGLGASLVAIAWVYQRFIFPRGGTASAPAGA